LLETEDKRPYGCLSDASDGENMTALEFRAVDAPPNTELLRGLEQQEIDLILAAARPRRFRASFVMTHQGHPAEQLFLLWQGRARYFFDTPNEKKLILRWITPGHIFGAAALALPPSTYLVSTEAVRNSIVLVWDGPTIRGLTRRFPRLMINAFRTTIDYLSWYVGTHAALTSQTALERLAHVLLGYAASIGQKVSGGIELDVTNEELAHAANITPYTTSRLISEWHRTGAVRKSRAKILLRSPDRLFLRAV
jgi:CRP/FNR family transcriptional regulator, nitrogen oxide reductase regulator